MIVYNNQAPKNVNNVGQFGATEGSIGAYKSAAAYAADAKYWALLSQTKYDSVEDILAEVERLYAQGLLIEEDIIQLRSDFKTQQQVLLGLIQSTNTAIFNANTATELSKEATQAVLAQLDIISNMTVQTTALPPGSMATGSYDSSTGVFSFGIPEGQPGRDGTDGTISDIGSVAIGVPVPDDYGFYVDKEDGGLYRADMSDIANLIPSIRSISINGGEEQTGAVSFNSVSSFNTRTGDVVPQSGDYTAAQVGAFSVSNNLSEITNTSEAIKNIGLSNYGIGSSSLTELATLDWQTFNFVNGGNYFVNISAMTNTPTDMVYNTASLTVFINVVGVSGSTQEVRVVPDTSVISRYQTYAIRISGAAGSRTFYTRAELSSAIAVTVDQGGTGATTASAARTNLGLGSVSTESIVPISKGGTGSDNAGAARINLNLERFSQTPGETWVVAPGNKSYLTLSDTLWGVFDLVEGWRPLGINQGGTGATTVEIARTNLGLGSISTLNNVPVLNGGTGATTADGARTNLGLGSVATLDNIPIANGGTGATTVETARSNLGLGAVSTFNIVPVANGGTASTTVDGARNTFRMSQQSGQYGSINNLLTVFNSDLPSGGVVSFRDEAVDAAATYRFGSSLLSRVGDTYATLSVNHLNGNLRVSGGDVSGGIASTNYINNIWGTRNTTVDPNGFIKQASPIVKVFGNGEYETNIDAEGVTVKRLAEGVYEVSGCLGLNSDASWGGVDGGFEIPIDRNKQPRVWLDYEVKEDGSILVKTYHRTHPTSPVFARNEIEGFSDGDPIDIPSDAFISVRVEMPSE